MKWATLAIVILAGLSTLVEPSTVLGADANAKDAVWHVTNMHQHPWFIEVVCASVGGWILGMVKGFSSTGDWLKKYLPSKPLLIVFIVDLLVFVAFGGYLGTGIYNPANLLEAFAAGLSWPVGLGALATKEA